MWGAGGREGGGAKKYAYVFGFCAYVLQKYAILYAIFARILAVGRVSLFMFNRGRGHTTKTSMAYFFYFGHMFFGAAEKMYGILFCFGAYFLVTADLRSDVQIAVDHRSNRRTQLLPNEP